MGGIDNYGLHIERQLSSIPAHTPNSACWLVVAVDPLILCEETDETTNAIVVPIRLTKQE